MKKNLSLFIGLIFLGAQLAQIIYSRTVPTRFFCWAPFDTQDLYEISAQIDGKELSSSEIKERYRLGSAKGWQQHSVHNLFKIVTQYEQTYGRNNPATVTIIYQHNGNPQQAWHYPQN